jgi:hypothetical protein
MKLKCTRRTLAAMAALAVAAGMVGVPATALAGDTPAGFYYGADTNDPGPVGGGVEYTFPNCGGAYGDYVGRVDYPGDSDNHVSFSNAANANAIYGYGIGSQNYYLLSGPTDAGATTASAALAYGEQQGNAAMSNVAGFYNSGGVEAPTYDPIIYADVESWSGDGWGSNTSLNRDVFNGFFDEIYGSYAEIQGVPFPTFAGIYGPPGFINSTLSGSLPKTFEWTNQNSYGSYFSGVCASSWSSDNLTAQFYMGDTTSSPCAVAYQYIVSNSIDYDQVDAARIENGEEAETCT